MNPNFTPIQRNDVVQSILNELETVYNNPREEIDVSKEFNKENVKRDVHVFSFNQENDIKKVMLHTIAGLKKHGVQVTHPSYFGLFNPRPNFPSIMADIINSYLNPQLAAWSHAPYAAEIERLVIKEFCEKFGYVEGMRDGTFCTGGAESNLTAVLCALQYSFSNISEDGITSLYKLPTIYCSSESHHSIEKAARIAQVHQFIDKLPARYNTNIGDRGEKFSGGEQQRISIARAILQNPPIIILDEATSALDSTSEMLVQKALKRVLKERTAIIVAHRLSTVKNVDRIIVLKDGKINETGTHNELLNIGGEYKKFVEMQTFDD